MAKTKSRKVDSSSPEVPTASTVEKAAGFAKILSSLLPPPWGVVAQMVLTALRSPLEGRREQFLQLVVEDLEKLKEKVDENLSPEVLASNETFVTAFLQVYQISLRNHQREKLEALRNALLNVVLPGAPDESLQLIFLNLIDTFSPWHIHILKFLDNPKAWMDRENIPVPDWHNGSTRQLFSLAFKHMTRPIGLDDLVFLDLANKGLIRAGNLDASATTQSLFSPWTTEMGKSFLSFIGSPLEGE